MFFCSGSTSYGVSVDAFLERQLTNSSETAVICADSSHVNVMKCVALATVYQSETDSSSDPEYRPHTTLFRNEAMFCKMEQRRTASGLPRARDELTSKLHPK